MRKKVILPLKSSSSPRVASSLGLSRLAALAWMLTWVNLDADPTIMLSTLPFPLLPSLCPFT